jgi:hypothetical protein
LTIDHFPSSHVALYLLGEQEHLAWCPLSLTKHDGIQKLVLRLKSPGFRLDERRLANDRSHAFSYQTDGSFQVPAAVT